MVPFVLSVVHSSLWSLVFLVLIPLVILKVTGTPWDLSPLGAFPIIAGILLSLRAFYDLSRKGGTTTVLRMSSGLVREGLYSKTRNPIYIGVVLILLGESLAFSSPYLGLYTLLLWFTLHLWVVYVEEPLLVRRFGEEALEYLGSVPRWVAFPRIWTCSGRRRRPRSSPRSP